MAMIKSKPEGGRWDDPDTWVGGVVPTGDDEVTIYSTLVLPQNEDGSYTLPRPHNWANQEWAARAYILPLGEE